MDVAFSVSEEALRAEALSRMADDLVDDRLTRHGWEVRRDGRTRAARGMPVSVPPGTSDATHRHCYLVVLPTPTRSSSSIGAISGIRASPSAGRR